MAVLIRDAWSHRYVRLGGVRFHYVEAGGGPLVVLLHGFPEFWYSWRHQIGALAAGGLRVAAPDLRGYNESGKPAGLRHYRTSVLAEDVCRLIRHLGCDRAAVVGHDWGGVIAWKLAGSFPEVVDRLVVLNAPHPAAYWRELRRPGQWLRSAYILFFQLPLLPEWLLRAGDFALLEAAWRWQPARTGAFSMADIRRYREALARPGALSAALNYYRALFWYPHDSLAPLPPIAVPTLLIWGERDPYLGLPLTEGLSTWVRDLRVARLPSAGHWVQIDAPARVNRLLLDFLK
jgi:pimeloyl-ACP methyl ester carboxylesterase